MAGARTSRLKRHNWAAETVLISKNILRIEVCNQKGLLRCSIRNMIYNMLKVMGQSSTLLNSVVQPLPWLQIYETQHLKDAVVQAFMNLSLSRFNWHFFEIDVSKSENMFYFLLVNCNFQLCQYLHTSGIYRYLRCAVDSTDESGFGCCPGKRHLCFWGHYIMGLFFISCDHFILPTLLNCLEMPLPVPKWLPTVTKSKLP